MRLLANENFPGPAVAALRQAGHDVFWARTDCPGAKDTEILGRAVADQRLILTFDKDFGELAFRSRLPAPCGIILFRISLTSPDDVARRAVKELAARNDWTGTFAIVEEGRVRVRLLK